MNDHDNNLPAVPEGDEPVPNPGLPPHHWRPTDVDPKAEKRAERQVAAFFGVATVALLGFFVSYFAFQVGDNWDTIAGLGASNLMLGLTLAIAFLCIGIGLIHWARKLMTDQEIVELRHPAASSEEDRSTSVGLVLQGVDDSGIGRRPLVRNSLLGALGLVGLAPIIMLRDLGPLPGDKLLHTIWKPGMRVVRDVVGTPIHVSDLEIGDLVNAEPAAIFELDDEGHHVVEGVELQIAKSKGAVILLRMEPGEITPWKGRENWSVEGIVCFSKICTHVGCPISLNERTKHHLLCPCHQSTFDLADNGKVIFGPAARHLPQLPIEVDDEGYLVAQSDFTEPVGPSFWERDKT
ncbi:Rieske 2Fe-2S domain-containing protein [Nocardioides agariphilus]|uniref:Cytochrome bc1 complex Rieske iron-sulfur subunit n=1 Tax=Nocardioides agariphilus TaxID=433664 RepID=A0A930YQM3_9ACTN|nr:Rieske 2Fe-2S domain-containing protein [Nocardioides agariphilus]